MDKSLQKIVGANDGVEFSKAEMADRILGLGSNVYGEKCALA